MRGLLGDFVTWSASVMVTMLDSPADTLLVLIDRDSLCPPASGYCHTRSEPDCVLSG